MEETEEDESPKKKKLSKELEEFKKRHTESFMFFLEEYDKWRQLKQAEMAHM